MTTWSDNEIHTLIDLFRRGNLQKISAFFDARMPQDINAPIDPQGNCLLDLAAKPPGHQGLYRLLADLGAEINRSDEVSCLEVAVSHQNTSFLQESMGDWVESDLITVFKALTGSFQLNSLALAERAESLAIEKNWKVGLDSILHYYAARGRPDFVRNLIERSPDVTPDDLTLARTFVYTCYDPSFHEHLLYFAGILQNPNTSVKREDMYNRSGQRCCLELTPLAALSIFGANSVDAKTARDILTRQGADPECRIRVFHYSHTYGIDDVLRTLSIEEFLLLVKTDRSLQFSVDFGPSRGGYE